MNRLVHLPRTLILAILAVALLGTDLSAQVTLQDGYRTGSDGVMPKGRELYFYGMRSWPFGMIPQGARHAALGAMEKMSAGAAVQAEDAWRQIGPMSVGGRVRTIAVHPTDGNTLWIGAADGGVWRSTDRGANWTALMQDANAITMGALAVDPSNPQVLYAGTGELSSNVDAYTGAGMYKSEDGGDSWRLTGLTSVGAFSRIVVHPTNSSIVWAGATKNGGGFYRSLDAGRTWTRVVSDAVSDITVNPQNPQELWIALMSGGIRYSSNGGESFTNRSTGIGGTGITINRMSVQVAPSNPSTLYALAYEHVGTNQNIHYSRIYKSTNGAMSWQRVYDNTQGDFLANTASQGWYNNVLTVKPDDANVVLAGGVRMVRTSNGGSTWSTTASSVHPDHHAFAFDPTNPSRLYNGNDGGMYRSDDAGFNFTAINNDLAISQFYAMAVDQRLPDRTYGGTQDNGTLTSNSTEFGDVFGGDGFYVAVDHTEADIVYIEREHGQMYRLDRDGATPMYLNGDIPIADDLALWSSPLLLDPHNPELLYSGRSQLYICYNPRDERGAVSWVAASPEVRGNISAIAVSPLGSDTVFIGSAQGIVMRTTNGMRDWEDLSFGHGLPNRAVTDIIFSATEPGTLYITYSGFYTDHVFKSTDLGETWASIGEGLPDIPHNALALHPEDERTIFVGTDLGMFVTVDGGDSWSVFNEGLPRVAIVDLEVHRQSGMLRAATHGRSMFERGIGGEPIEVTPNIIAPYGGEVWTGSTQNVIAWGGFNDPQGVRVQYSLDGETDWRELGNGVGGKAFRWNTVNASTMHARIRVISKSDESVVAVSNSFSIIPFNQGAVLNNDNKPSVPYGIASDGEFLWATDFGSNILLKIDPATLDAVEKITLPARAGDSLFTDLTYYPPRQSFFIHRLNSTTDPNGGGELLEVTKTGEILGIWRSPMIYPIGLAWLGEKNPDLPYLMASDRDGTQRINFFDPEEFDPNDENIAPILYFDRATRVELGPRGIAAGNGIFWQVITDFTGSTLNSTTVQSIEIETAGDQIALCSVPLTSPLANTINARGVEVDESNQSLWITDYGGSIYQIAGCDTPPGPSDSGVVPAASAVDDVDAVSGAAILSVGPNPFGSSTTISFRLATPSHIAVRLYDAAGRLVSQHADARYEAGTHDVNVDGAGLPAGLYRFVIDGENGMRLSGSVVRIR